tara:strand:+ start:950 stop:2950 length:2001 start_codon:yes stop_codon:yes gene_type:complete
MPTSRFLKSGTLGVSYSDFSPYKRVALIAYPFDSIEAIYQYTDIGNRLYSNVFEFSGNQTLKDKGFDVKFLILNEKKNFPSVALGFRDLAGTGLFSSEYLVANKYINNFDLTLGIGWGNLSDGNISNPLKSVSQRFARRGFYQGDGGGEITFSSFFRGEDAGLFGGLEYFFKTMPGLRYKMEYDSTNYKREAGNVINYDSRVNFGLTYQYSDNIKFSIARIRGNTIQFGFSISAPLGKKSPFIKKQDLVKKIPNTDALKNVTKDDRYLYLSSLKYLNENDLSVRAVNITNETLEVAFAQNKFLAYPQAYGRAFNIMNQIAPEKISKFTIIPMNTSFELAKISIDRKSFQDALLTNSLIKASDDIEVVKSYEYINDFNYVPKSSFPAFFFNFGPGLQTHIGGPDRFFVAGLNLEAEGETLLARNVNIQSIMRWGISDTFQVLQQGARSALPQVRTNQINYIRDGDKLAVARLQMNIFNNPARNIYTKISGGYFEEMFGGFGGEILYRPFNSRFAIGADLYRVKQRAYNQLFSFREYLTTTGHVTTYFMEPRSGILTKLIGGKYLAGDSGFTLDISKRFKSGLRIGGFFSLTDISKEEFGEGSFDKGFYINIPLESFYSNHSRRLQNFGLRPVTRDGAARLVVGHDLYGVTDEASYINIMRDKDAFFD